MPPDYPLVSHIVDQLSIIVEGQSDKFKSPGYEGGQALAWFIGNSLLV